MVLVSRPLLRGEMWFVALDPVVGSEQAKTRPCVIVQRDAANRTSPTTIVVPLTDASGKTPSTIKPLVRAGDGGLAKDSIALCNQLRTVDRKRFVRKIGALSGPTLATIDVGLVEILDVRNAMNRQ